MIVQLPIVCTDRMIPLQHLYEQSCLHLWFSMFDDRPARLFDGLEHIRATIMLNVVGDGRAQIWATKYNRWYSEARSILFPALAYIEDTQWNYSGAFPKAGARLDTAIFARIHKHAPIAKVRGKTTKVYYHNAPQYWVRATTFAPYFYNDRDGIGISDHIKSLTFGTEEDAHIVVAALCSSLFYWWFVLLSNCRDLTLREIERFPVGLNLVKASLRAELCTLSEALMRDFEAHKYRKETQYKTTGRVVYDEYYPRHSKSIIDEIDRVLAKHYGFTDEELDYIINYDIKYRMGADAADGEGV